MNILYLSCHAINEYEDVLLFTELGHEVLSQGAYANPDNPGEKARPPIPKAYHNEKLKPLLKLAWGDPIPQPLIEWCDLIYILGIEAWLPPNWERIKHKHVVFRSIGQAVEGTEKVLSKYRPEGLKIVRYSPLEQSIPGFTGEDALIRFYKDPDEYKDWNGQINRVITVAQNMKARDICLKFTLFEECTRYFPRKLYGFSNEDARTIDPDLWGGPLTYEQLKQVYRENRIFFYTCTFPAQYTMAFQEAWMTGIPIVAIGKNLAEFNIEVPQLIANGINGFTSNSLAELRRYISALLEDYELAKRISSEGRKKAIELFGKAKIKEQWHQFFNSL
jgi:hypothetical protein